jgi:hypothetical protein
MPDGSPPTAHPDPDRDYLRISQAVHADFGWDHHRAHELALFCTFAIPSISRILDQTGEFAHRGQRRYDDTVALLREVGREGPASGHGRAAIKHLNSIHRPYEISDGDLAYVLATFVVIPVRWIGRYGWRNLTQDEITATVRYYQAVGRLMGIRQIPPDYEGFARYLDAYERDHRAFSEANRRVAVSLLTVMGAWFPRPLRPLARSCIAAGLGRPLRQALGLAEPWGLIRAGVPGVLRLRAALIRLIPPLRHGRKGSRRLRTYPCGYALSDLGPAGNGSKMPGGGHAHFVPGPRVPRPESGPQSC